MAALEDFAYRLWEARGRPLGDDWSDWFAAEKMLRSDLGGNAGAAPPDTKTVPMHVEALAVRLLRGWRPTPPPLATPRTFTWAGRDFSASVRGISVGADQRLEIATDRFDLAFYLAERDSLRNKALEGELTDGARFVADLAFLEVDRASAKYWTLTHGHRETRLWVATIGGLQSLTALGNLCIRYDVVDDGARQTCTSILHHRFVGAYTYYLLKCKDAWFLIVDTGSLGPPTREEVYPDMLAMQFVLGRAFFFDILYGLNLDGEVVGMVGGRHGRDHGDNPKVQGPVPMDLSSEHWMSALFEAIIRTYRERPKLRLYIALSYYLDALASAHVENTYLVLHVALEGFSYWLLGGDERAEPPLVDKPKWKAWLKSRAEEIREVAAPDRGQVLFNRIQSIPKRASSSRVVQDAFASVGLSVTEEMAEELDEDGRGLIVHAAIMFKESQADVDAYRRKNALVRTMLIALVARVVGYRGAIVGWEHPPGHAYGEPDPAWWPVDQAVRAAARRVYLVDARSPP